MYIEKPDPEHSNDKHEDIELQKLLVKIFKV